MQIKNQFLISILVSLFVFLLKASFLSAETLIRIETPMEAPRWAVLRAPTPGRQRSRLPRVLRKIL